MSPVAMVEWREKELVERAVSLSNVDYCYPKFIGRYSEGHEAPHCIQYS